MCVMSEYASSKSAVHGIVELRQSTAAVSGPAVVVTFILDTCSQPNVVGCAVLKSLQLKFPDIDTVRPPDFPVGMANQTTAPPLGVTKAIDVMITSGAAGPLRLGGIEFVVLNRTSDLLRLVHSITIELLGVDVEATISSSSRSDMPSASWAQSKEIKTNSNESIDSLQATHGNELECDEPAFLLTNNSPERVISPDVKLSERNV